MTEPTRRQFLKRAFQGTGIALLTTGLPGSNKDKPKPKPEPKPEPKPKKVDPKRKGFGPQAKAYRKFLRFITRGSTYPSTRQLPKNKTSTWQYMTSPLNLATSKNVARQTFLEATTKGKKSKVVDKSKTLTLDALETRKLSSKWSSFHKDAAQAGQDIVQIEVPSKGKYQEKEIKLEKVARIAMANELKSERSKKKWTKKREIFEKIKSRVKKATQRIRGGGGKMPSSGMETAKDPTGMSLIRKYTL